MLCVLFWWQCIVSGLKWPNLGQRLHRLFMHYHKQCKFRSGELTLKYYFSCICSDYVVVYFAIYWSSFTGFELVVIAEGSSLC